jgi:glycosyltransferase involved in cell wall biosynthesis
MKIGIHSSELNQDRIDGTRVYLSQLLQRFSVLDEEDDFFIYHQGRFNTELVDDKIKKAENYNFSILKKTPFWTQTKFATKVFFDKIDTLWMPVQNMPIIRRRKMKTVITAHDLAFKLFPKTFPRQDLRKLNLLADYSFPRADKIIAISQSTKNDLLKFYPKIKAENIKVVHHGFDKKFWQGKVNQFEKEKVLQQFNLIEKEYLIYVGVIQPRKNLQLLIQAFDKIKKNNLTLKLVLAGGNGWLWQEIYQVAEKSQYRKDIIFTGGISFLKMKILLQNAQLFILPSLYEGFGMPILEALASKIPVISANNSSLVEVGGEAVEYFSAENINECVNKIEKVFNNQELQKKMIAQGLVQLEKFSWQKSAIETLNILKKNY